ncbi:unnamed protein product [Polarella glacialis]|uniref:Uncharacterized protein n=1 Tax=Polarella glacialis TaxID=89957 RepID=A0A813EXB5_POLGL|nr:unnamed protein product [Polarella glacialis]
MANGRLLQLPAFLKAAEEMGVSADSLALGAVMAQPFKPLVLSGAVTVAQLQSNLARRYDGTRSSEQAEVLAAECRFLYDCYMTGVHERLSFWLSWLHR